MDARSDRQFVSFERLGSGTTCRRAQPKEQQYTANMLSNVSSVVVAHSVPLAGVRRNADTLVRPHLALDAELRDWQ